MSHRTASKRPWVVGVVDDVKGYLIGSVAIALYLALISWNER